MASNYFWPCFVAGPSPGDAVPRESIQGRLATVNTDDGDFTYYRRKLIFNGQVVVCFAPSNLSTADVIHELLGAILESHSLLELIDG